MEAHSHSWRRSLKTVCKVSLAVAILVYLIRQAQQHDAFARLVDEPKRWTFLAAGLLATFIAVTLSFIRWHMLVRAVGIDSRLFETMRLAALGFMLNFVSLGSIGGDLFRAIFLARDHHGQRTHAVTTVVADRLTGLMTQLSLASAGIVSANLLESTSTELAIFCRVILGATAMGWLAIVLVLLVPALSGTRARAIASRIPLLGAVAPRIIDAVRDYRSNKRMLGAAALLSIVGVLFYISSYYLIARGLPVHEPSWTEHLVVVPIASLAGAIPATPNGLGTLEAAVEVMYQVLARGADVVKGDGTLVALAQRLTMMAMALVGMIYYFAHRAEVSEMIAEAEEAAELA